MKLRAIVGCERSGTVRRALRAVGVDAWSCDMMEADDRDFHHIKGDVLKYLEPEGDGANRCVSCARTAYGDTCWKCGSITISCQWDLGIFHPPCPFLTVANNGPITHGCSLYTAAEGQRLRSKAIAFFMDCINAPIARVCVENPIGIMSTIYRKPDQIIQPFEFNEDASKKTCLWLKGLPKLTIDPLKYVAPRWVCKCGTVFDNAYWLTWRRCPSCKEGKALRPRWANQTNSGQNKLAPSPGRAAERARTYEGIARQMAAQWIKQFP